MRKQLAARCGHSVLLNRSRRSSCKETHLRFPHDVAVSGQTFKCLRDQLDCGSRTTIDVRVENSLDLGEESPIITVGQVQREHD